MAFFNNGPFQKVHLVRLRGNNSAPSPAKKQDNVKKMNQLSREISKSIPTLIDCQDGGVYLGPHPMEISAFQEQDQEEWEDLKISPSMNSNPLNEGVSICALFESVPQREFIEEGYDPVLVMTEKPGGAVLNKPLSLTSTAVIVNKVLAPKRVARKSQGSEFSLSRQASRLSSSKSTEDNLVKDEVFESTEKLGKLNSVATFCGKVAH